jgi:DNA polymerase/3'-5' exonuclease PolX
MELSKAREIAIRICYELQPFCDRINIAGSIRRKKPEVKDIEICLIPKPYDTGLFETGIATVINKWQKVKGELEYGKCRYTQRMLPEGIAVDLFFAEAGNWGNIFLIRTGDWEFSKKFMGVCLPKKGYKSVEGWLTCSGKPVATPEEADLFNRAGIPFIEPQNRNLLSLKNY